MEIMPPVIHKRIDLIAIWPGRRVSSGALSEDRRNIEGDPH